MKEGTDGAEMADSSPESTPSGPVVRPGGSTAQPHEAESAGRDAAFHQGLRLA